jgi:hypothetical protein
MLKYLNQDLKIVLKELNTINLIIRHNPKFCLDGLIRICRNKNALCQGQNANRAPPSPLAIPVTRVPVREHYRYNCPCA